MITLYRPFIVFINEKVMAIQVFANTITNNDQSSVVNYFPTFNPIDKIVELYDALLKKKDEKIALMERILGTPGLGTPGLGAPGSGSEK